MLFLSDNGGCGEHIDNSPDRMPGTVDTYATVDAPWANASNTPFRKYKVFDHEGGIATPLIAHWPAAIEAGAISHEVGHVIDFLPTFAELAGADYPGPLPRQPDRSRRRHQPGAAAARPPAPPAPVPVLGAERLPGGAPGALEGGQHGAAALVRRP